MTKTCSAIGMPPQADAVVSRKSFRSFSLTVKICSANSLVGTNTRACAPASEHTLQCCATSLFPCTWLQRHVFESMGDWKQKGQRFSCTRLRNNSAVFAFGHCFPTRSLYRSCIYKTFRRHVSARGQGQAMVDSYGGLEITFESLWEMSLVSPN